VAVGVLLADQAARGGSIVLAGGSTPGVAYKRAAALQPDWGRVTLWWGDERCVPPDDERSNYRLAQEALLDHLETPPAVVHRIRGELPPSEAADEYEHRLDGHARPPPARARPHVASLFPGSPQLYGAAALTSGESSPTVRRPRDDDAADALPRSIAFLAPRRQGGGDRAGLRLSDRRGAPGSLSARARRRSTSISTPLRRGLPGR
jgi:6-phosphogluconolactonase